MKDQEKMMDMWRESDKAINHFQLGKKCVNSLSDSAPASVDKTS